MDQRMNTPSFSYNDQKYEDDDDDDNNKQWICCCWEPNNWRFTKIIPFAVHFWWPYFFCGGRRRVEKEKRRRRRTSLNSSHERIHHQNLKKIHEKGSSSFKRDPVMNTVLIPWGTHSVIKGCFLISFSFLHVLRTLFDLITSQRTSVILRSTVSLLQSTSHKSVKNFQLSIYVRQSQVATELTQDDHKDLQPHQSSGLRSNVWRTTPQRQNHFQRRKKVFQKVSDNWFVSWCSKIVFIIPKMPPLTPQTDADEANGQQRRAALMKTTQTPAVPPRQVIPPSAARPALRQIQNRLIHSSVLTAPNTIPEVARKTSMQPLRDPVAEADFDHHTPKKYSIDAKGLQCLTFIREGDFDIVWPNVFLFTTAHLIYFYALYYVLMNDDIKTRYTWITCMYCYKRILVYCNQTFFRLLDRSRGRFWDNRRGTSTLVS